MADDEAPDPFDNPDYELPVSFEGPCTCEHTPGEHGWVGCKVDGCACDAHWEE